MASSVAGAAGAAGAFSAVPVVGWAVGIGAALFDTYVLMPALQGKGRNAAKTPRLLDSPVGSNEAGAPRVWAIGARVRVPTHILWQSTKVRESTSGSNKAGTQVQQRRAYTDALIALNDRKTRSLTQLVGNGKLVLFTTRNLVSVRTNEMTVSVNGSGRLVLTMDNTATPDFADLFAVDDVVELRGFVVTAGNNLNTGFWKVYAVEPHTSSPSTITLRKYSGQTVGGTVATAGTPFSPASVTRIDDAVFSEGGATVPGTPGSGSYAGVRIPVDSHLSPFDVFDTSSELRVSGLTVVGFGAVDTVPFIMDHVRSTATVLHLAPVPGSGVTFPAGASTTGGSSDDAIRVRFASQPQFTAGLFPSSFVPATYFHDGSDDQEEDPLLAAAEGVGDVPAYRGVACQGLDDFYVTLFGEQLPYSLEAVIDVDPSMTWAQALATILRDRCDIPDAAIDTSGVSSRPFLGYYMRGGVPAATSLQPLLLAGQIVGQERDGSICLFDLANSDSVEILNESDETHFGCRLNDEPAGDDKWTIEDSAVEDLPTSVGVRHQDPDNGYADGYQPFGMRNPAGVEHSNETEVDLSSLVLTRKDAANLAATVLRRAWINRRTYRFTLPACYLHLLENDLLEWTDDDGRSHIARIIQRDIGSDFRVAITAVAEDVDLAMFGVPTQSAAGDTPRMIESAAVMDIVVVDTPAIEQQKTRRPAIEIAVQAKGSNWAGATLWESLDGTSWQMVASIGEQSIIGTLDGDMAATTSSESYGTSAVSFWDADMEATFTLAGMDRIEECTDAEAIGGKNWAAIIGVGGETEIVAFTTASASGETSMTLGRWLRGLRGTTAAAHAAGSRIVMLTPQGGYLTRREFAGTLQPAIAYRVVPSGQTIDDVETVPVVAQWWNARPLPVRSVTKTIGSSPFDARFTVTAGWTRAVLPLGTQPPHPMDEPVEAYRFTIYDPTGRVVRRVVDVKAGGTVGSALLRDRWLDYTATDQTIDGYTPSGAETFWIDVQQIGEFGLGPSIRQEL